MMVHVGTCMHMKYICNTSVHVHVALILLEIIVQIGFVGHDLGSKLFANALVE